MVVVGYLLAALVGLSLGLMGGGGSILTVPIFVYVLGYDPKLAIAMSLPVIGITSAVGVVGHWRAGNVNPRTAITFGAATMAGAFAGARLAAFLTGEVQLLLLAIAMVLAAVMMLRSARQGAATPSAAQADTRPIALGVLVPVALGVGLLTGLVGIGGGFLVVPALVVIARAPMTQAIGTSLLVIAINALAAFAGYIGQVHVPWAFVAGFTAMAVLGILVGTQLVRFIAPGPLKRAFAVFLIVMGSFMLFRNRAAFRTHADARRAAAGAESSAPHCHGARLVTSNHHLNSSLLSASSCSSNASTTSSSRRRAT